MCHSVSLSPPSPPPHTQSFSVIIHWPVRVCAPICFLFVMVSWSLPVCRGCPYLVLIIETQSTLDRSHKECLQLCQQLYLVVILWSTNHFAMMSAPTDLLCTCLSWLIVVCGAPTVEPDNGIWHQSSLLVGGLYKMWHHQDVKISVQTDLLCTVSSFYTTGSLSQLQQVCLNQLNVYVVNETLVSYCQILCM